MKRFCILLIIFYGSNAFSLESTFGLPKLNLPSNNPQTTSKIALGKKLFNDTRFSSTGSISCASCHQEKKAFTDGKAQSIGINGLLGKRNAPTLVNSAFMKSFFHDGRRESLEQQSLDPLTNPVEHGLVDHEIVLKVIQNDPSYLKGFLTAFGITVEKIDMDSVAKAIASYERTLIAGNSPFDQYFFNSNRRVLNTSEARGLRIFRRKGNCANCHEISWNNALFSDNRFYNIGIGIDSLRVVLPHFLKRLEVNMQQAISELNEQQQSELGRFIVTRQLKDIGAYKTPTLRNINLTAPYMHDGSLKTLEEVVEYYNKGGKKNPFLAPAIFPLHLTTQEKSDLVAFMKKLTSSQFNKTN